MPSLAASLLVYIGVPLLLGLALYQFFQLRRIGRKITEVRKASGDVIAAVADFSRTTDLLTKRMSQASEILREVEQSQMEADQSFRKLYSLKCDLLEISRKAEGISDRLQRQVSTLEQKTAGKRSPTRILSKAH